ncbi:MAG TPA: MarR family transcriptional regulator [Candidatus Limnocylindrales bacterium]|nr:MarR family transcriptional regulator [Candidatus Limnocylindrales bacterium]
MSRTNARERLLQHVIGGVRALDGELDLMDQAIADALSLNRTDAQCMDLITRFGPITAGELAHRTGLTAGAITTVLDRLEAGRWIARRHDTQDRRRILVERNEAKAGQFQPIFSELVRSTRQALDAYSDQQLAVIDTFLQQLTAVVSQHRTRLLSRRGSANAGSRLRQSQPDVRAAPRGS